MANWCYTNITISHKDQGLLEGFFEKIEEWTSKDYVKNDFGHNWLGNIVGNSGIAKWTDDFHTDSGEYIKARGTLNERHLNKGYINLATKTAWGPMMRMWVLVCEKYLPGAEIIFTAEESGNLLYQTNDPDLEGKYYIDVWEPPEEFEDIESDFEASEEYTIAFLQKVLKTDVTDINELLKLSEDEDWFFVDKWQRVDLSNCE